MVRVMIVDDHAVVRVGLKSLIELHGDFSVIAEAGSGEEAVEVARETVPDVVVMDVRMPGMSGIDACRAIVEAVPDTKVIMLTSYADDEAIYSAILAGASGYVLKQTDNAKLLEAIEQAARNESLLDPHVTGKVLKRMKEIAAATQYEAKLSETEKKILVLIAEGKRNKEIAEELFLAEKTVRNYVSKIFSKLNLANRAAAAAYVSRTKPLIQSMKMSK
ncbi:response regulator transcription factor [Dethiobacter alkaliphilus]|uniref:Two component transcriptional regulator, LuxR family n=1 Tax=Dethiobacter alkaliphilus AHT 1 TaxID=555088 RepID=C0GF31_DETAL|nr:response regulator transcription factor [Dethiobacter alkaliphilus]EEG78213.1 two component transcriptional regulator, LuxR family [Dethiobacter alkaliphilus AHT 1]